ncbi:MAG: hypothetical protein QOI00_2059 [Chloroflexota bacterium]|nr:hypothetical protein [Chloroflexota bacterium]
MTQPDELDRAERDAEAEAEAAADAAADRQALLDNNEADDRLSTNDYSLAFTPRNVAVGLAIVAGLVAFAASRRRRRGPTDRDGG